MTAKLFHGPGSIRAILSDLAAIAAIIITPAAVALCAWLF